MTRLAIVIPLLAVSFSSSSVCARSTRPTGLRTVETIAIIPKTDAAETNSPAVLPAPTPTSFQVNDLSRRAVEFRMARALAEMANSPVSAPPVLSPVSTVSVSSTIVVPGWMRSTAAVPATMTFVPGCGTAVYRPTGFLSGSAERRRAAYYSLMSSAACEQGIPVGLFDAMILRESGYDPAAISPKQAVGFAQLMPSTAAALGVNRYDPLQNMRGGARYLRQQLDRFGRVELALAAYNAGPGRIRGAAIPGITETQAYVSSIISNWQRLNSAGPRAGVKASRY